jgi:hypothetical protein
MRFTMQLRFSLMVVLLPACATEFDKYRFGDAEVDDADVSTTTVSEDSDVPGPDADEPEITADAADTDAGPDLDGDTSVPDADEPDADEPDADEPDAAEPVESGTSSVQDASADASGDASCPASGPSRFRNLRRVGPVGDPVPDQFPGSAFDDLYEALVSGPMQQFGACTSEFLRGLSATYPGACASALHGLCRTDDGTNDVVRLSVAGVTPVGFSGISGEAPDGRICVLALSLHTSDGQVHGPFGAATSSSAGMETFSFRAQAGEQLIAFHGYDSDTALVALGSGDWNPCISSLGATFGQ